MDGMETKKVTIESLAQMVARGFEKTASKDDVRQLREEMVGMVVGVKGEMVGMKGEIDKRFDALHVELQNHPTHADLERELQKYKYAKEIDEVRGRVKVCEEKLGIAR